MYNNNLHSHTRPHFQKCQLFIGHNLESPGEGGKVSIEWSSLSVWSLSISVRNCFGCLSGVGGSYLQFGPLGDRLEV